MRKKFKLNFQIKILILLVISTFLISIGYATVNNVVLNVSGSAQAAENGDIKITSVVLQADKTKNVTEKTKPKISDDGQSVSFDLSVKITQSNYQDGFHITYLITVTNDSVFEQKVLAANFTPQITGSGNKPTVAYNITNADGNPMVNDMIPAKTAQSYYVTIYIYPAGTGTYGISGDTTINTTEEDTGTIIGSLTGNTEGNLSGNNTRSHFTASVINSHNEQKTFSFSVDSTKFKIVDQNGNDLPSMTINANDTDTYDFYIEKISGSKFMVSPQNLNIKLDCDGASQSIGTVSLIVDVDQSLTDFEAPVISNVTATIQPTQKEILVEWNGTDDNTVINYYIETYTSNSSGNGTLYETNTVPGSQTSYVATVPNDDAYYYFKVYGIDQSNNIATSDEISSCSTSSGHCSRSENQKYKWNFTVVLTLTNAISSAGDTTTSGNVRTVTFNVEYDGTVSTTLSGASNDYKVPSAISSAKITYPNSSNAENLPAGNSSQTAYSYNSDSGLLSIYHITGDVAISAEGTDGGTCLAKGTKILLANGAYKNIEDVKYDDLLAVWNYDTGSLTYEYPLWIENEHKTNSVIRVTFEDDSYIDFVGNHAIYNTDLNLFVNITDSDKFHIGSHVAKLNNGTLENLSVKNIEKIYKDTTYYFVGSTTYYNVFANNILTTDTNVMISNLYGFEDNAKWPEIKKEITKNTTNMVDYDYLKDVLPYYMYDGFRVKELGFLINTNQVTLNEFKYYISSLITSSYMLKQPINKNGDNYWMVTTEKDNVIDKNMYLRKEGSTYILPNDQNIKGWLNTTDNKIYKPGQKIIVTHGLHFISIDKETE